MQTPSKFQIDDEVINTRIPATMNRCLIEGVIFRRDDKISYIVKLLQGSGGARFDVPEDHLAAVPEPEPKAA